MATTKLTITLDDQQFQEIKALIDTGQASTVSGFVRKAVETALNDVAGWRQMLDESLAASGGPITDAERAWADGVLGYSKSKRARRARR